MGGKNDLPFQLICWLEFSRDATIQNDVLLRMLSLDSLHKVAKGFDFALDFLYCKSECKIEYLGGTSAGLWFTENILLLRN